jgi:hypothetical protein
MPAKLIMIEGPRPDEVQVIEDDAAPALGRSTRSDIFVPDARSSRNHCRIERIDGRWQLTDLGSLNGTFVNGERVSKIELQPGDVIRIGSVKYRFDPVEGVPHASGRPAAEADAAVATDGPPAPVEPESASARDPATPASSPELESAEIEGLDEPLEDDSGPIELFPEEESEVPLPAEMDPDAAVCAQCGRKLPADAVERDEATEIGGRLYCHRCVIQHGGDTGPVRGDPNESDGGADMGSVLESLERASKADRVGTGPLPQPSESEPPKRGGLLGRLRRKPNDGNPA